MPASAAAVWRCLPVPHHMRPEDWPLRRLALRIRGLPIRPSLLGRRLRQASLHARLHGAGLGCLQARHRRPVGRLQCGAVRCLPQWRKMPGALQDLLAGPLARLHGMRSLWLQQAKRLLALSRRGRELGGGHGPRLARRLGCRGLGLALDTGCGLNRGWRRLRWRWLGRHRRRRFGRLEWAARCGTIKRGGHRQSAARKISWNGPSDSIRRVTLNVRGRF